MATPEAITLKRANAVLTIDKASAALAEKFGIEIQPMPQMSQQDPDFAHAAQLEHYGNVLQSLAVASKSAKAADFEPAKAEPVASPVPEKVEEAAAAVEDEPKAKKPASTPAAKKGKK
jgi:hypothetical protein